MLAKARAICYHNTRVGTIPPAKGVYNMMIWLDMDGTIADLYGVEGWLDAIIARDTRPYDEARGMNLAQVARALNRAKARGHKVGIVTWLPRDGAREYCDRVATAKRAWLARHLPKVEFDRVDILPYGTPKETARDGILFDDEKPNRDRWNGKAYEPREITKILKEI